MGGGGEGGEVVQGAGCSWPGCYLGSLSWTTPAFVASENRLEFLDFEFQKPDTRKSKIKSDQ